MANELTISGSLSFSKSGVTCSQSYTGKLVTVTGTKYTQIVQSIATTEEAVDIGDIGTVGFMIIENLDATNFVSLRPGTGTANLIKIPASKAAGPFMLSIAPWAIADTAACSVKLTIVEA